MRPSSSPSKSPSPATSGLSVHVPAETFHAVKSSSTPSSMPSPSVSTLLGSAVRPVRLVWFCVRKSPKEAVVGIPGHCWRAKAVPMVVTNHCGEERLLSVSECIGDTTLYSSQLVMPSSSASCQRSVESRGLSVHASSKRFQRANQISQPSGMPSSSVSALSGSAAPTLYVDRPAVTEPEARSAKVSSGAPKSSMLSNNRVVKFEGRGTPSRVEFPLNKSVRTWYSR